MSFVLLLLVVALAPLSLVAGWTHTTVSDTDGYLAAVAPLASDHQVQAAVADRITDEIADRIDLPGVRPLVHEQASRFVASDAFATAWTTANRHAHRQFVGVITGRGTDALDVDHGTVSLNLGGIVSSIRSALVDRGLTAAQLIPDITVSVPVFESAHIVTAQRLFRLLDRGVWLLPVVAAVCIAGAILCARRRLRTASAAALCVALGMGLLAVTLGIVRMQYLDALPPAVPAGAGRSFFDALVEPLWSAIRQWAVAALAAGVVLSLIRMLQHRARTNQGRQIAAVVSHHEQE